MDTTRSYNDLGATSENNQVTLAAAFADRDQAHDVIRRLHEEGFGDTWLGITRAEDTTGYGSAEGTRVEADNWFARFFGEGDESLHEALLRHGVAEADAAQAGSLAPNSAIVTVDGANHPEVAAQIISSLGGRLITRGFGATGLGTAGTYAAAAPLTGSYATDEALPSTLNTPAPYASEAPIIASDAATAPDYGLYRAGTALDEDTRLQLREERLRIDKERRALGTATIGKEIVSQTQEIDVPLIREELFIERRPVTGGAVADSGVPIGSDTKVVSIPLTEEKLNVSKVAVVTEEVVVGKREIQEMGHVSETTRKETLDVTDATTPITSGSTPVVSGAFADKL